MAWEKITQEHNFVPNNKVNKVWLIYNINQFGSILGSEGRKERCMRGQRIDVYG